MKYLETGSFEPEFNLAFEEYVLEHRRGGEYLMLWQNVPTVVIGLNQNAMAEVNLEAAAALGVRVVRRATGGGAVYHDLDNLNYSIIAGAEDAASLSLRRFMEPVRDALRAGDDERVLAVYRDAIAHKPQEHEVIAGTERFMSQIGG